MGKIKTKSLSNSKDILRSANAPLVRSTVLPKSQTSTEDLLVEATAHLEQSQPEKALPLIQEALKRLEADTQAYADLDVMLQNAAQDKPTFPTALTLGADVSLALGDIDKARAQFELAVQIDPNGALVSAEPYLQLAQLCEEGGQKSIEYFENAIQVMKNEIEVLEDQMQIEGTQDLIDLRRAKIADALCGMAEVYMTDLSWESDAEHKCDQFVTEAVAICPETLSAGVLQTLASIRISQERVDEAKRALAHSMSLWKDIPVNIEDAAKPDFATRISLVRLLIEVEQEEDAVAVLDGLVKEDDQSVEAWYLGGWCHLLLSQKPGVSHETTSSNAQQAWSWLATCLRLYTVLRYEDEPLRSHADELMQQLNESLALSDQDGQWETDEDEEHGAGDDNDEIEAVDVESATRDRDIEMT